MQSGRRVDPTLLIGPEKVKQAVTCPICLLVVQLPVYRCDLCQNHFCQSCMEEWWDSKKMQREKTCVYGCENPQLKLLKRIPAMTTLLEILQYPCQNVGCDQNISFERIKSHDEECPFKIIVCPNIGCGISFQRKVYAKHESVCEHKTEVCEHCKGQIKRPLLVAHQQSCEQRPVLCQFTGCGATFKSRYMQKHKGECGYKVVSCKWCINQIIQKDVQYHQDKCQHRKTNCGACKLEIKFTQYQKHMQQCQEVEVYCDVCDNRFSRRGLSNHSVLECLVSTVKEMKRVNMRLLDQNTKLRLEMQRLKDVVENFEAGRQQINVDKSKQLSSSIIETMRMQELSVIDKDLQRINYSIASIQKLRKEEVTEHMKYPHFIQKWCIFCKEIDKKFAKMLEPLLEKKKEYEARRSEYQAYYKTRKG